LAAGKPVVGVSTLAAIAREIEDAGPVMIALDARRGEVYTQLYLGNHAAISPPALMTVESAGTAVTAAGAKLFGSGANLVAASQSSVIIDVLGTTAYPAIENVARCTAVSAALGDAPKPLYLRAPDAKPQTRGVVERVGVVP
jgi:tRNA threonylcarbamoyladenosine biosynthesis protein TsaB